MFLHRNIENLAIYDTTSVSSDLSPHDLTNMEWSGLDGVAFLLMISSAVLSEMNAVSWRVGRIWEISLTVKDHRS